MYVFHVTPLFGTSSSSLTFLELSSFTCWLYPQTHSKVVAASSSITSIPDNIQKGKGTMSPASLTEEWEKIFRSPLIYFELCSL